MIRAMWADKASYRDRRYDHVRAAAEELALPVVTHSGSAPHHEYGEHLGIYVSEDAPGFRRGGNEAPVEQGRERLIRR
jgi:hypothetical protein